MGLDISHKFLTLPPYDKCRYFYTSTWDSDCNVPLENYSKYITTIEELMFNNEEQLEEMKNKKWFCLSNYLNVFIGELNGTVQKQVSKYIINQKLDKLESRQVDCQFDGFKYQKISFGELIKEQVVYYIPEIGYQRKRMNDLFYDKFRKHLLWGKLEDFELAYSCVGSDWELEHWGEEVVNQIRKDFKRDFIDQFEFGRSLLCASF